MAEVGRYLDTTPEKCFDAPSVADAWSHVFCFQEQRRRDELSQNTSRKATKSPARPPLKTKTVVIGEHTAAVVRHALVKQLHANQQTLDLIRLSRGRPLTRAERHMLPPHMIKLSREALNEQCESYVSLDLLLKDLVNTFDAKQWD